MEQMIEVNMAYKTIDALMRHLRNSGIAIKGGKQKRQLINTGYLHGYTHGTNKMTAGVDCRFIVDHYFDMKKRVK